MEVNNQKLVLLGKFLEALSDTPMEAMVLMCVCMVRYGKANGTSKEQVAEDVAKAILSYEEGALQ